MTDPHAHHPAIKRGHYEVKTFTVGRIAAAKPDGTQTIEVVGSIPSLLRVVVAGLDVATYLPEATEGDGPRELTQESLVAMLAPYLREGLIDPWTGRGSSRTAPVVVMPSENGLSFAQAVACLN